MLFYTKKVAWVVLLSSTVQMLLRFEETSMFLLFWKFSWNFKHKYLKNHKSKVCQPAHHWKENFILYINPCKVVPFLNFSKSYCFSKTCQYFLIFLKLSFNFKCKYLTNDKSKVHQPAHHWKDNFIFYKKGYCP